jgi:hypothetical protein
MSSVLHSKTMYKQDGDVMVGAAEVDFVYRFAVVEKLRWRRICSRIQRYQHALLILIRWTHLLLTLKH